MSPASNAGREPIIRFAVRQDVCELAFSGAEDGSRHVDTASPSHLQSVETASPIRTVQLDEYIVALSLSKDFSRLEIALTLSLKDFRNQSVTSNNG
jgi:hypothetical protein